MSKLIRRAALGLAAAATTAIMTSALVTSAEAGCRYYGPGSTGCAHKAPPMARYQQPVQNFNNPAPTPYSYGRVIVNPNTFRSGGGILLNGSRRMGAAWVAPSCRRIGAALFC